MTQMVVGILAVGVAAKMLVGAVEEAVGRTRAERAPAAGPVPPTEHDEPSRG
jgi:hypothetical protein